MLLSQQEVAQDIHQTETVPKYVKPHTKQNQKSVPKPEETPPIGCYSMSFS